MQFEKEGDIWIYKDGSYETTIKNSSEFAMHVQYNGYDILIFGDGLITSPEFFEINLGVELCDARVINGYFMVHTEDGDWRCCKFN